MQASIRSMRFIERLCCFSLMAIASTSLQLDRDGFDEIGRHWTYDPQGDDLWGYRLDDPLVFAKRGHEGDGNNVWDVHWASRACDLESVARLIKELGVASRDRFGHTALTMASMEGCLDVVKWLVEVAGADVEAKSNNGYNALHSASGSAVGNIEVVKWLVQEGQAPIEAVNLDGDTALLCAYDMNNRAIVEWLLKVGRASVVGLLAREGVGPAYEAELLRIQGSTSLRARSGIGHLDVAGESSGESSSHSNEMLLAVVTYSHIISALLLGLSTVFWFRKSILVWIRKKWRRVKRAWKAYRRVEFNDAELPDEAAEEVDPDEKSPGKKLKKHRKGRNKRHKKPEVPLLCELHHVEFLCSITLNSIR
jgi:hypothetical protein